MFARIERSILILVLALSGLYWLPGVSPELLEALKNFLIISAVLGVVIHSLRTEARVPKYLARCIAGLVPAIAFGSLTSLSSLNHGIRLLLGPLLSWAVFSSVKTGQQARSVVIAAMVPSVCSSLYMVAATTGWITPFQPPNNFMYSIPYEMGFSFRSNAVANGMSYFGALLVYFVRHDKGYHKIFWMAAGAIMGMASLLSGGRAGTIVLFLTAVAMVTLMIIRKMKFRVPFKSLGATALLGGTGVFVGIVVYRPELLSGRGLLYANAWNQFLTSPVVGSGWGTQLVGITKQAHNLVLQSAISAGVLGMLCTLVTLLFLVISIMKCVYKKSPFSEAIGIGLLGALMMSLVTSHFPFGPFYMVAGWWALFGVLMRVTAWNKEKRA